MYKTKLNNMSTEQYKRSHQVLQELIHMGKEDLQVGSTTLDSAITTAIDIVRHNEEQEEKNKSTLYAMNKIFSL